MPTLTLVDEAAAFLSNGDVSSSISPPGFPSICSAYNCRLPHDSSSSLLRSRFRVRCMPPVPFFDPLDYLARPRLSPNLELLFLLLPSPSSIVSYFYMNRFKSSELSKSNEFESSAILFSDELPVRFFLESSISTYPVSTSPPPNSSMTSSKSN